jgi:hypothetical protein
VSDWQERENVRRPGKPGFEQKPGGEIWGCGDMSLRSLRPWRPGRIGTDGVEISLNMLVQSWKAYGNRKYIIIGGNQLYLL